MDAPQTTLNHSQPCLSCGYDLVGLQTTGLCPECSTPVERSLRGDLLRFSSDNYRLSLLRGVSFIRVAIVLSVASMLLWIPLAMIFGPVSFAVVGLLGVLSSAISYYGYFLYSVPDPEQLTANKGETPRRIVRVCITIALVATVLQTVIMVVTILNAGSGFSVRSARGPQSFSMLVSFVGGIAGLVQFVSAMLYTQWLAPRIPSERIRKRAKLLMWLGPLLFLFYCTIIAPIVALVLYYNMFTQIRRNLIALQMDLASLDMRQV